MTNFVFNIAKGRGAALSDRVKSADPATSALILIPLQTAGLESDAVLVDRTTLAAVLGSTTQEQTTMGRKVLVAADLPAIPAPDNANDRNDRSLPTVTWALAEGPAISKILVCYRPATGDGDSLIVPVTAFDLVTTPSGVDIQLLAGLFFRAQS